MVEPFVVIKLTYGRRRRRGKLRLSRFDDWFLDSFFSLTVIDEWLFGVGSLLGLVGFGLWGQVLFRASKIAGFYQCFTRIGSLLLLWLHLGVPDFVVGFLVGIGRLLGHPQLLSHILLNKQIRIEYLICAISKQARKGDHNFVPSQQILLQLSLLKLWLSLVLHFLLLDYHTESDQKGYVG